MSSRDAPRVARTPLQTWAARNGCTMGPDDVGRTYTHTAFTGGKYCVDPDLYPAFADAMLSSVQEWGFKHVSIHELAGPTFRFFLDMDLHAPSAEGRAALEKDLLPLALEQLSRIEPSFRSAAVMTTSTRSKRDRPGVHWGYHVYALGSEPHSCPFVDRDGALAIRNELVRALDGLRPEPLGPSGKGWNEIVDGQVYASKACGLRMPGCYKADRCRLATHTFHCCGGQHPFVIVDRDSVYGPLFHYHIDFDPPRCRNPPSSWVSESGRGPSLQLVLDCSLRLPVLDRGTPLAVRDGEEEEEREAGREEPEEEEEEEEEGRTGIPPTHREGLERRYFRIGDGPGADPARYGRSVGPQAFVDIPADDPRFRHVERVLAPGSLHLDRLSMNGNATAYFAWPVERYCNNRRKEHSAKSNYFLIFPNLIMRKCTCRCELTPNERAHDFPKLPCGSWSERLGPPPPPLRRVLFPDIERASVDMVKRFDRNAERMRDLRDQMPSGEPFAKRPCPGLGPGSVGGRGRRGGPGSSRRIR